MASEVSEVIRLSITSFGSSPVRWRVLDSHLLAVRDSPCPAACKRPTLRATPGIARQCSRDGRHPICKSIPLTCTSIGAGAPWFNTSVHQVRRIENRYAIRGILISRFGRELAHISKAAALYDLPPEPTCTNAVCIPEFGVNKDRKVGMQCRYWKPWCSVRSPAPLAGRCLPPASRIFRSPRCAFPWALSH